MKYIWRSVKSSLMSVEKQLNMRQEPTSRGGEALMCMECMPVDFMF